MSYEEAIRKINSQKLQFLEEYVDYGGTSKAYDMAIEALEKQIPKKPNIERQAICFAFRCPDCNKIFINKYDDFVVGEKEEFCCECGQHIDWSDENGGKE